MDFFFTDETGSSIVKSDSLRIWRAIHAPSGSIYRVKQSDEAMRHNDYATAEIDGQKVMSLRDYSDNPVGKWFTPPPALARTISLIRPNETFWFTGGLFGNYQMEDVSDGSYKNALFAATISDHDKFTTYPMLMVAKGNDDASDYVYVNSYNNIYVPQLSYSIHSYTPPEGRNAGSKYSPYSTINESLVIWADNNLNDCGEWNYYNSYGSVFPIGIKSYETRLTYDNLTLFNENGKIIQGAEQTDSQGYIPYKFKFGDNASDESKALYYGYYIKLVIQGDGYLSDDMYD